MKRFVDKPLPSVVMWLQTSVSVTLVLLVTDDKTPVLTLAGVMRFSRRSWNARYNPA